MTPAKRLPVQLALTYAAGFACFGLFTPFLPVWLDARGLSPQMIGLMLALPLLLRVVALMPVTQFADRIGRLRDVMILCAGLAALAFAGLGQATTPLTIAAGLALAFVLFNPVVPLMDAYALTAAGTYGFDFPRIRLWGSVSFVVLNIAGGAAIAWLSASVIPLLCAAACLPVVLAGLRLPAYPGAARTKAPAGAWGQLSRTPGLMALMAGTALVQGSHGLYYAFAATYWQAKGHSAVVIGLLWSLGVVAEIVLMWRGQALLQRFGAGWFLAAGAFCGVARWGLMAMDPGLAMTAVLQLLHAGTFGATFLGAMALIAERVPPALAGSGQGMAGMTTALATMVVTLLSGLLWAQLSVGAFAFAAVLCAGGGAVLLLTGHGPRGR